MRKRIFITGGGGFIGPNLAGELLSAGYAPKHLNQAAQALDGIYQSADVVRVMEEIA